jgi:L-2,4-diaminobutyrate decarboxylase
MALVTARRERQLACNGEAVVLASADAHVSIGKALAVMGLPASAAAAHPRAGRWRYGSRCPRADQLDEPAAPARCAGDRRGGHGRHHGARARWTPLPVLAPICRHAHGVWLHVDGAIGAVFALSERHRQAGAWASSWPIRSP